MFGTALVSAAFIASASAHAIFQEVYVNGEDQGHLEGIRVPDYDGPISDVTSNDIICNGGINPYHTPISTTVIPVAAGDEIQAEWHRTLNGADPSDSADPIDPSHKGPTITYLAKIDDATSMDITGLKWFKIQEDGLDTSDNTWGVDRMIANKGKVTLKIPECIESGQYLMRHEIIALHAASSYPGAQFYVSPFISFSNSPNTNPEQNSRCAQLDITSSGTTSPSTVSFPGAYKGSDPGITINIYQTLSSYTVPGPDVLTC